MYVQRGGIPLSRRKNAYFLINRIIRMRKILGWWSSSYEKKILLQYSIILMVRGVLNGLQTFAALHL